MCNGIRHEILSLYVSPKFWGACVQNLENWERPRRMRDNIRILTRRKVLPDKFYHNHDSLVGCDERAGGFHDMRMIFISRASKCFC